MLLKKNKYSNILECGVDEVGRGCLLGRVYAAAVIMPEEYSDSTYELIKDSKKLSKSKRNFLDNYIKDIAIDYGIGYAEVDEIDKNNILKASILAMHRALDNLNTELDMILVDGKHFNQYIDHMDNFISHECIINGDGQYLSIASASILAKTARDNYVKDLVEKNPNLSKYDLLNNMGYGTKKHLESIYSNGISKYHRKTFGICKNYR